MTREFIGYYCGNSFYSDEKEKIKEVIVSQEKLLISFDRSSIGFIQETIDNITNLKRYLTPYPKNT